MQTPKQYVVQRFPNAFSKIGQGKVEIVDPRKGDNLRMKLVVLGEGQSILGAWKNAHYRISHGNVP